MECNINGIPAWEHPKQVGCGSVDTTSISTGSSDRIGEGTASSPSSRSTYLNLLPTRNNNNAHHRKQQTPTSATDRMLIPSSPTRPPSHQQQQQQHQSAHPVAQHQPQPRTPNKSMDHRRMLNMDGYTTPNKMMISFDSDSQSCCPSVGDITWDHTEAMAFHNNSSTPKNTAAAAASHRQPPQQHPWENFTELKPVVPSSSSKDSSNSSNSNSNQSPIPPKSKNRVFLTAAAVPASGAVQQQHLLQSKKNKPPPLNPQRRRNSVSDAGMSTCPSIPDATLLPMKPTKSTCKEISLAPIPRTISGSSNNIRSSSSTNMSSIKHSPPRKVVLKQKSSGIPTAPAVYANGNRATEIQVNFSDCFVSHEADVPSIIAIDTLTCQPHATIARRHTGSSIDLKIKSTIPIQPRKEIDVMPPTIIDIPLQEKSRNEGILSKIETAPREPPLRLRSSSFGSNSIELHRETSSRSSTSSTERGHNSIHNSIITIPMSNVTMVEVSGNTDYPSNIYSKQSSTVHIPPHRNYQTKTSSRDNEAAFQKWNVSKSSVNTSKSSKSASSNRSSSYNTVQQLEESIQNLEATLQMKASYTDSTKLDKESDDHLVDLALESSFNDIYLRPSISDKRSIMQHRHPQQQQYTQESFSGTSASMLSSSMMSSSLLSTMSMNTNNSMLLQQRRVQPPAIPPNLLIPISTISTTTPTTSNSGSIGKQVDDYTDMKNALAVSSAIMDH